MVTRTTSAGGDGTSGENEEATVYANHWDGVYANRPDQLRREWHCDLRAVNDRMGPFLRRALQQESSIPGIRSTQEQPNIVEAPSSNAAPAKQPLLVDVGCGSSDMAPGIRDAMAADSDGVRMRLLLLDISSVVIESMAARYQGDLDVECLVADCRSLPVGDAVADVVLDKGTLDALYGDADKMEMMRECSRVLSSTGVMISISFGAVGRLGFLDRACKELGLQLRTSVVGDGDPMAGHQVVFLTAIAKEDFDISAVGDNSPDDLTRTVLDRIKATGSMYDDQTEEDATAFSVFD